MSQVETTPDCVWRGKKVVCSWEIFCWDCSAFESHSPQVPVPDPLQRRLGWPLGGPHDIEVLEHLAAVRSKVLASFPPVLREDDAADSDADGA